MADNSSRQCYVVTKDSLVLSVHTTQKAADLVVAANTDRDGWNNPQVEVLELDPPAIPLIPDGLLAFNVYRTRGCSLDSYELNAAEYANSRATDFTFPVLACSHSQAVEIALEYFALIENHSQ